MNNAALFSSRRKLSARLQAIYQEMLVEEDVWDFCCDHGYLGLSAFESGNFKQIHFVDQAKHLIARLRAKYQLLSDDLYFWDCAGEKISEVVKGNLVIAGVGASTAVEILKGLIESNLLEAKCILISPHKDEEDLRPEKLQVLVPSILNRYNLQAETKIPDGKRERPLFIFKSKSIA